MLVKTPDTVWTIAALLRWASGYFTRHAVDSPRTTAELLLAHVLNLSRLDLYLRFDQPLAENELAAFKKLLLRRVEREPAAYIVGRKAFWSIELEVNPDVLIPRPDTECLVEQALALMPPADRTSRWHILELGTGSGAIVLSLAKDRPRHLYVATDISPAALQTARRNASQLNLQHQVFFLAGNWFAPLQSIPVFDLIISNPPYVAREDLASLQPEITFFEPLLALDGEPDGLGSIRPIIQQAPAHLKPGGHLLLEIGHDQADAVRGVATDTQVCREIHFHRDYGGNARVLQLTF